MGSTDTNCRFWGAIRVLLILTVGSGGAIGVLLIPTVGSGVL